MLELAVMGTFSAVLHTGDCIRALSLSRRTAELLALLAMSRGRFFPRSEIGHLLGMSEEEDVSPEAVSTAVWRLRRTIEGPPFSRGDYIVTNRYGAIGLNGPRPLSLDATAFVQLASSGLADAQREPGSGDVAALRGAQKLYKDCLLPGFTAEWVLIERERLRRTYLDVVYRLMQVDAARCDYESAIEDAQNILQLDNMREDVHRALMQYFVLNGQRALALRQFEICRAALKQALAIQPMRETILLYQKISEMRSEVAPAPLPVAARSPESSAEVRQQGLDASSHLRMARDLMAQADSHLNQSLDLLDR